MSERPNFEGVVSAEGEKAPFRRMIDKQREADESLKSSPAKWAALAAERLSETAIED